MSYILILTSKSEHDKSFMEYIHKEYFPLLKQQLEITKYYFLEYYHGTREIYL